MNKTDENTHQIRYKKELNRINKLLKNASVDEKKHKLMQAVIENTAWIKVKLDIAREEIQEESITVEYDNGGNQKGIRENPKYKGYKSLWASYMGGMSAILNLLPEDKAKEEKKKAIETKTMLEIVRSKHKQEA